MEGWRHSREGLEKLGRRGLFKAGWDFLFFIWKKIMFTIAKYSPLLNLVYWQEENPLFCFLPNIPSHEVMLSPLACISYQNFGMG